MSVLKASWMPSLGLLLMRITFGGVMLVQHGWGKLLKLFGGGEIHFADPFGLGEVPSLAMAVGAEVVCSALIVVGFFSRWATVPLIITMGVAFFDAHGGEPFHEREMSFLYGMAYIILLLTGPGKWAVNNK